MGNEHLVAYWIDGDFPCAIWENSLGALCGYVGIPSGHPWYGDSKLDQVDVHGGITYTQHEVVGHPAMIAMLEDRAERERNLPLSDDLPPLTYMQRWLQKEREQTGERRGYPYDTGLDIWWIGFDCAHLGDLVPGSSSSSGGVYRDEEYVRSEIKGLLAQAADAQQNAVGQETRG